jgi:hypothetical protein
MDPTQVENAVDLPNQMIGGHHPVQIKRIKELTLSAFPSTHHDPLLRIIAHSTESWIVGRFNQSFATQSHGKPTSKISISAPQQGNSSKITGPLDFRRR